MLNVAGWGRSAQINVVHCKLALTANIPLNVYGNTSKTGDAGRKRQHEKDAYRKPNVFTGSANTNTRINGSTQAHTKL